MAEQKENPDLKPTDTSLPDKEHQQNFIKQGYSAIAGTVYVSFYGNEGSCVKTAGHKIKGLLDKMSSILYYKWVRV